ncbi:hypothetical protein M011DRAFT_452478 [Sporormia fimetaria CBS 119925]|uniref:ATPase inhibitor, mitochondrial n=1 Tax=Sporormia fimetaria CBS 119925 TaxID=1340428 RepID=A0A6A6UYS2_9PLEO|nr:hypothetical protein M011DRAFT_452478 [Sporormia fimetaria CBS 119925]
MFRTSLVRAAAPRRLLSTSARLATGETGSGFSRPGGQRSGDAFTKREQAAEELYIRQEEKAKLLAIKEKLQQQRKHIDELEKHIDDVTKERSGGDQN